ncbi:17305_t:CDS:2 [Gigaspora rosea]|nr:17305_t:CDS:2 [Gigaspora rosea]
MSNYLPQASGYLPYWTLFVSVVAVFNTIQNLITVSITKQIYSAKPEQVTELSARLFAVWTFTSGVIRFYAAYNLNNKTVHFDMDGQPVQLLCQKRKRKKDVLIIFSIVSLSEILDPTCE